MNLHLRASYTYLSLGFCLDLADVTFEGVSCFFCMLAEKFLASLKDAKPVQWPCLLPPRTEVMQDEWGKTQDTMGVTMALEKNLNQALLDLHALGLPTQTLISVTSWRTTSWMSR